MEDGAAVIERGFLYDFELALGKWHRSKDRKQKAGGSDFSSSMMNKKWWLEEQFNVHMMRFQQVNVNGITNQVRHFEIFNSTERIKKQGRGIEGSTDNRLTMTTDWLI